MSVTGADIKRELERQRTPEPDVARGGKYPKLQAMLKKGMRFHSRRLEVKDKDPNYSYRQVKNDPNHIEYREEMGYEVVMDTSEAKGGDEGVPAAARTYANGRYVLMRRPKEIHDVHNQLLRRASQEARLGPRKSLESQGARLGVEVEDKTRERYASAHLIHDTNPNGDE